MKTAYTNENGVRVFECEQNGQTDAVYMATINGKHGPRPHFMFIVHGVGNAPYVAAEIWNRSTGESIKPENVTNIEFVGIMQW